MKLYVANGHGVRPDGTFDPGAAGYGTHEQEAGDVVVANLANTLRGYNVEIAHEAYQRDPNFPGTIDAVNDGGFDGVISVHHDWSGAPRGAFGHWYPGSTDGARWANYCYDEVEAAGFPMRPSWHKARGDLALLSRTRCPALLWECDRVGALSDNELVRMGETLAVGTARAFGLAPAAPPPTFDLDVAVIYEPDSPDDVAARALALEHVYAARPVDHAESIGYGILVGRAQQTADRSRYPNGVLPFIPGDRQATAEALIEATGQGVSRNRENPTLADLKRGQGA